MRSVGEDSEELRKLSFLMHVCIPRLECVRNRVFVWRIRVAKGVKKVGENGKESLSC